MRDGENIYKHRGLSKKFLDSNFGLSPSRFDDIYQDINNMMMVIESLVEEKVHQFLQDNPDKTTSDIEVRIENVWISLWESGPTRLVKKVVITGVDSPSKTPVELT